MRTNRKVQQQLWKELHRPPLPINHPIPKLSPPIPVTREFPPARLLARLHARAACARPPWLSRLRVAAPGPGAAIRRAR